MHISNKKLSSPDSGFFRRV